jgi:hypothetical protein
MRYDLKRAWQVLTNFTNQDLWAEFSNLRKYLNDQDIGVSPSTRISTQGSVTFPAKTVTAAYTLSDSDYLVMGNTTSGTLVITLPNATTIQGRLYVVMNIGNHTLTIVTTSGQTINGGSSIILSNKYFHAQLFSDGSNWVAI